MRVCEALRPGSSFLRKQESSAPALPRRKTLGSCFRRNDGGKWGLW